MACTCQPLRRGALQGTAFQRHIFNPKTLPGLQVGLRVLGVVENMSGLRVAASALRFTAPDGCGREQDVSDSVRAVLASFPGLTAAADVFAPTRGGAERVGLMPEV